MAFVNLDILLIPCVFAHDQQEEQAENEVA